LLKIWFQDLTSFLVQPRLTASLFTTLFTSVDRLLRRPSRITW